MREFYTPDQGRESMGDFLGLSQTGCLKRFLVGSLPRAAIRKLSVDDHARHTTHAVLLCSAGHIWLIHIENLDLTGRAGNAVDQGNGFIASRAASGEDFNFSFCSDGESPP